MLHQCPPSEWYTDPLGAEIIAGARSSDIVQAKAEGPCPDDLPAQPLISDQEPSAEGARAHTLSHTPDFSMDSPMGNQTVSGLLE